MKTISTQCAAGVLWVVMLEVLSIQFPGPAQAADASLEGTKDFAPRGEGSVIASGAAEDTLKACMARIPDVASAGQRMLAEQSCVGEEETRKAMRAAPKF